MTASQPPAIVDPIAAAFSDPNVRKIYVNSFAGGVSTADVFVILFSSNAPQAVLQMSYTVAKTMGQELTRIVGELEKQTGQTILTIPELQAKLFPATE